MLGLFVCSYACTYASGGLRIFKATSVCTLQQWTVTSDQGKKGISQLAQLALHNPHIWANSLKPVCFLCFLLFWCPLLPFIEAGTLKIYTKMVLYMKNEIFDLKYPLHGV